MNLLISKVEEAQQEIGPEIYANYKQLKADNRQQRFEREKLVKIIESLKTETEV
jgi:hypothetical protein